MHRVFFIAGAVAGFVGVALGAFGAHVLRERISADMLAVFQTGVQYQNMHALTLLVVSLLYGFAGRKDWLARSGWLFIVGMLVFSGSLYALALSEIRVLGAITPLGGICFLAGWLHLVAAGVKQERASV